MNPIKTKCFKVVRVLPLDDALTSVAMELICHKYCIRYHPNKLIKPLVGKIFAFSDLSFAEIFAGCSRNRQIWEAEGYGATTETFRLNTSQFERIEEFWRKGFGRDISLYLESVPTGTILCKSIKLIKRVK
jgi:hypothetical protein